MLSFVYYFLCWISLTGFNIGEVLDSDVRIFYGSQFATCMGGSASRPARVLRMAMKVHRHARCEIYPRTTDVLRFPVPDDKVSWDESYPEYNPVDYTAPSVAKGPVWADVDFRKSGEQVPEWNTVDGKINRVSHTGSYKIDEHNCPRNPMGRTGMAGRGLLGRWGPNHAADPIVTRILITYFRTTKIWSLTRLHRAKKIMALFEIKWKRDSNGKIIHKAGLPVAQFIAIQRRDNHEWAIPGGMVDAGEVVTMTIRREFGEEALNTMEMTPEDRQHIEAQINHLFSSGEEIYKGYVDDPRNTDNAWMETTAMNFHDGPGNSIGQFDLHAGDDAMGVKWMDLDSSLQLYANHVEFLHKTAKRLKASW